ncbi:MAG: hypothetical protein Q4G25_12870 [Paracoccus sp. (in: a-proteobacteria)]|nr:hypothetical protein [Paracoccus sp. (in: a-proteobacteria)]
MTHYLVELYSPKPAWLALDEQARAAFFEAVGTGMEALGELGVEPLSLSEVDPRVDHAAPQQFLAIWRCADKAGMDALVAGISASGWHEYFKTINAMGAEGDLVAHLGQLAALRA